MTDAIPLGMEPDEGSSGTRNDQSEQEVD